MRERIRESVSTVEKRFADLAEACYHTSLGRNSLSRLAKAAGAERKVGKRVLYDLHRIDEYFDKQAKE